MRIADTILPEWDQEMASTRRVVERVPDEKLDWRPHPRSWTVRELATHLVMVPSWTAVTIGQDSIDLAAPGHAETEVKPAASRVELLERLDRFAAEGREAVADASDERLLAPWTLLKGGTPVLTMPRTAVLRGFVLSHSIHHRAQLGVYLRLLDVPVPAIYGPSADEGAFQ